MRVKVVKGAIQMWPADLFWNAWLQFSKSPKGLVVDFFLTNFTNKCHGNMYK